jgi:hypothetical protein
MITDSNQVCFVKMIGLRVQEGVLRRAVAGSAQKS